MRNFIPRKLARFAVLMVFVFLLAQSSVARAQGDNQQWFSSIIEVARNSGGWSDCQYGDENLLECHTKDLSVSPVYASKSLVRPPKQSGITLTAYGKNCWSGHPILIGEGGFVWSCEFDPAGGPVVGSYDFQQSHGNAFSESQGTIEGFFQGGDGGAISGTFSGQFTYGEPGVVETVTRPTIGPWKGNLYANGTGLGTYTGDDLWGDWSVQFDAQAFQAALQPNPGPNPNPVPNPNPNPNPNPGPIRLDQETLSILQSILGTPIIPITGAVAGGLIAWVISMLGGGKSVPLAPVNSSKAISAYQQKWIQKGWKFNPKTGRLEVQPGATDDKGHVWYKLPYDEGDSHYWVDKAKVQECERNLAKGLVYDHRLSGWVEPNDLAKYNSQREARHQQNIIDSAKQNARIQQDIKDAQAQRDADFKKWEQDFDKKEEIRSQMDEEKYNAFKAGLKTTYYDNWGKVFGGVETTADVAIALGAKFVPGGKAIEKSYELIKRVALSVDEGIDKGSVTTAVVDYTKRAIKDKVVSTVSSVLSLKNVSKPLDKMAKKVLTKGSRTGLKIYDAVTGKAKDKFIEGEIDDALESETGKTIIDYVGDSMKGGNLGTGIFR